jgi:predicted permease
MENIFNIVIPVFGIILCGYIAGVFKILDKAHAEAVNKFVYYFALPPLLFTATARAPFQAIFNWSFIAVYLGGVGLTLIIGFFIGRYIFRKGQPELTIQMFATIFANTAYMGIPIFLFAFGQDGTLPAVVATLAASLVLLGGVIAILEWIAGANKPGLNMLQTVIVSFLKNPVIMSLSAGVLFGMSGLVLPVPIDNFMDLMGNAAGPAALFSIGLSLVGHSFRTDMAELLWIVFAKLLVHPFLTWCLARFVIDLEKEWSNAAVILAAMPVGAMVYVIAQRYGSYFEQSSAAILVSTGGSVFTLSVALTLFGS